MQANIDKIVLVGIRSLGGRILRTRGPIGPVPFQLCRIHCQDLSGSNLLHNQPHRTFVRA